jgi:hypothetical protein
MPGSLGSREILLGVGLFVAGTLLSTAVVVGYLVSIRPDAFAASEGASIRRLRSPAARLAYRIGKNLLGAALVVVGAVLSLPGVPGQGLLTILVGLLLCDLPGKRALVLAVVRRPAVRGAIDRLRARFGRAPLALPPVAAETGRDGVDES